MSNDRQPIKRTSQPTVDDRAQRLIEAITSNQLTETERRDTVYKILTEVQPDEPTA
ncbi:MAG: hypothetical protein SAK29_18275 [Scytonema sp. PMC 1069.18]|nr:hypothetical protein [Scytonema sp. PMC 1069.18]MEC4887693.1 hypothetical protein [Scytonema sp. PMC 1070.18]